MRLTKPQEYVLTRMNDEPDLYLIDGWNTSWKLGGETIHGKTAQALVRHGLVRKVVAREHGKHHGMYRISQRGYGEVALRRVGTGNVQ